MVRISEYQTTLSWVWWCNVTYGRGSASSASGGVTIMAAVITPRPPSAFGRLGPPCTQTRADGLWRRKTPNLRSRFRATNSNYHPLNTTNSSYTLPHLQLYHVG